MQSPRSSPSLNLNNKIIHNGSFVRERDSINHMQTNANSINSQRDSKSLLISQQNLDYLSSQLQSLQNELELEQELRMEIEKKLRSYFFEMQNTRLGYVKQVSKFHFDLNFIREENKKMKVRSDQLNKKLQDFETDSLKKDSELSYYQIQNQKLEAKISELSRDLEQNISEGQKKNPLSDLSKKIENLEGQNIQLTKEKEDLVEKLKGLDTKLEKIAKYKKAKVTLENELQSTNAKYKAEIAKSNQLKEELKLVRDSLIKFNLSSERQTYKKKNRNGFISEEVRDSPGRLSNREDQNRSPRKRKEDGYGSPTKLPSESSHSIRRERKITPRKNLGESKPSRTPKGKLEEKAKSSRYKERTPTSAEISSHPYTNRSTLTINQTDISSYQSTSNESLSRALYRQRSSLQLKKVSSRDFSTQVHPDLYKSKSAEDLSEIGDDPPHRRKKKTRTPNKRRPTQSHDTVDWALLPDDVLRNLFIFADIIGIISLSRICTRWKRISNDEELLPFVSQRRAHVERVSIYRILHTNGIKNITHPDKGKKEKSNLQKDLYHLPKTKRALAENLLRGHRKIYNQHYILSIKVLQKSGAFKNTKLPSASIAKSKLNIYLPDGCLKNVHYTIAIHGVDVAKGEFTIDEVFKCIKEPQDLNLDPLILHPVEFLNILYDL